MNRSKSDSGNAQGTVLFFHPDPSLFPFLEKELIKSSVRVLHSSDQKSALSMIKKEGVDILLSTYRSDTPKTLEILIKCKEKYPSVERIFISDSDDEDMMRKQVLKGIISNFFEQPHGIGDILGRVTHIIEVRKILKNKKLTRLLNATGDLSTFHKTYYDFMKAIERDLPVKKVAEIIERDISLSAKVLKIANSAFYRSSRIGSIERACIYLGLETLKSIVFTVSLSLTAKLKKNQMVFLERIIYHSLKVNQNFQRFYKLETQKKLPEKFLSVGITHDIGKIIILQYLPERYNKIIKYQQKYRDLSFYMAELELGFEESTHAEIGAYFLSLWNFSEANMLGALFHHRSEEAFDSYREEMEIFSFVNEFTK